MNAIIGPMMTPARAPYNKLVADVVVEEVQQYLQVLDAVVPVEVGQYPYVLQQFFAQFLSMQLEFDIKNYNVEFRFHWLKMDP